jgi:Na+(H+)/acetate symporter ActP
VTIPLSFAVGVIVSLLTPEPEAVQKFEALEQQLHLGQR